MEDALERRFQADSVAGLSIAADGLNSDLHASAEYRAHLVTVLARRAVAAAIGR
jgi:carbon-monoxide dehydrogenase medium subunit